MKLIPFIVGVIVIVSVQISEAQDIKIVNVTFTGPAQPKTQIDQTHNSYTNHFTVSASYKMEVELEASIPPNTSFNVSTYAFVQGQNVLLGDARVGRATSLNHIFATYYIFPSSANFYGQCRFVVIADANNEIPETDESNLSNVWEYQATIHPPGEAF